MKPDSIGGVDRIGDMELNKIYNEDCLETMRRMPDNYVDLVLTDPRNYLYEM